MGNTCCNNKSQLDNIQQQPQRNIQPQQTSQTIEKKLLKKDSTQVTLKNIDPIVEAMQKNIDSKQQIVFPTVDQKIIDIAISKRSKVNQLCGRQLYIGEIDNKKVLGYSCGDFKAIYQGSIVNDKPSGDGRIIFNDDSYFQGIFDNGQPIKGIYIFPNTYYIGELKNYSASGKGIIQKLDGSYYYEGQFDKNLPHGYGTQIHDNGDKYLGYFNYGNRFGQGKCYFANGDIYEGNFYNDYIDGKGKMILKSGQAYDGLWKLGKMNGQGTYYWINGQKYAGQYKDGERNGHGVYYYTDGSIYEGEWKNGRQNGKGQIRQKYDRVQKEWKDGKIVQNQ